MAKTLEFTTNSPRLIKQGDTDTVFTFICKNGGAAVDLTQASDIIAKIGNISGYLRSQSISVDSLANLKPGWINLQPTPTLIAGLPEGNYQLEIWVTDQSGTSIYPSDKPLCFTITNNIENGSGETITTVAFDDFVKAMNKAARTISNGSIADGAVTKSKLANGSVTENSIANGSISPEKLMDSIAYSEPGSTIQIQLSSDNTEMVSGSVYTSDGSQTTTNSFNTLIFKIAAYNSIDLSNYRVGVNGGAFLDASKDWISSFSTGPDSEDILSVPEGAQYIAITVPLDNSYRTIEVKAKIGKYKLNNLVINSLPDLLPGTISPSALADYQIVDSINDSDTIKLSENNTTLQSGTYTSNGEIYQDPTNTYATLIFNCAAYNDINLSQYVVGVNGGAFLDKDKNWISSFSTTDAKDNPKVVPDGAQFIAITMKTASPYSTIVGTRKIGKYTLSGLVIPKENIPAAETIWTGKKIVWIGTSVSFGANATSSYPDIASKMLGFNLINASVPGLAIHTANDGKQLTYGSSTLSVAEYAAQGITIATAPEPYVPGGSYNNYYRTWEHVFNADTADADLYVFDVAPNNTNFAMDDWDAFNKNAWAYKDGSSFADHRMTFAGALLFLMDKMYTLNPMARMCFVLGSAFAYDGAKTVFEAFNDAYNIPILDVWGRVNTSPKGLLQVRSEKGTNDHPNDFGHTVLGKMIVNQLLGVA